MSDPAFLCVQACVYAAMAALCALVLVRPVRAGRQLGLLDLLAGGSATAVPVVAAAVLLPAFGLSVFGLIRFVYVALVVVLPVAALAVLAAAAARRVRVAAPARALAALTLLAAPVGAWTSFVEPYRLVVERAQFDARPGRSPGEPIRIGVLADLQCDAVGEHERAAVDLLLAERPDVILIPGDVMHSTLEDFDAARPALRDLLARLDAPGGVYFVIGDVDHAGTLDMLRETRVRPLLDEIVRVRVRDRDVTIGGALLDGGRVLDRLLAAPGEGDLRILVCHRPDPVLDLPPDSRIDLVVAGHTHGGQVVVPGFGPPMTLSGVPRDVARGGLHRVAGNVVYVSRGVGMERLQAPPMRIFCRPEVSVVTVGAPASRRP